MGEARCAWGKGRCWAGSHALGVFKWRSHTGREFHSSVCDSGTKSGLSHWVKVKTNVTGTSDHRGKARHEGTGGPGVEFWGMPPVNIRKEEGDSKSHSKPNLRYSQRAWMTCNNLRKIYGRFRWLVHVRMRSRLVAAGSLRPLDCSPPGSSALGIIPARTLECVAISFSGDLPDPETESTSPVAASLADAFFTTEPPGKPN